MTTDLTAYKVIQAWEEYQSPHYGGYSDIEAAKMVAEDLEMDIEEIASILFDEGIDIYSKL